MIAITVLLTVQLIPALLVQNLLDQTTLAAGWTDDVDSSTRLRDLCMVDNQKLTVLLRNLLFIYTS
ncbi:hypothetical protein PISMIDRAFT_670680 [Pisolithus microcarpus 441]|uniref:Secreted protein n=1 Tax=Pisolithus microcarpus 441 TaxID=765257 RepID=A0A0C9ZMC5_9AGAM|nr:hypothetical protein PISMIDRAFT_670680 [Pisolithus microcarpus 441]